MKKKRYWLASARALEGLKQIEVASRVGIAPASYCQIENGLRNPKISTAKKIAEILHFDWLRFYEEMRDDADSKNPVN